MIGGSRAKVFEAGQEFHDQAVIQRSRTGLGFLPLEELDVTVGILDRLKQPGPAAKLAGTCLKSCPGRAVRGRIQRDRARGNCEKVFQRRSQMIPMRIVLMPVTLPSQRAQRSDRTAARPMSQPVARA